MDVQLAALKSRPTSPYHSPLKLRVNLVWMEINEKNNSYNMGRLAILNLHFSLVWHTETVGGKG